MMKVAKPVIFEFLATKLKPEERNLMLELKHEGKITDLKSFKENFLEQYGIKDSSLARLRGLFRKKMSTEEVQKERYYEYGNKLTKEAHDSYRDMNIRRELWPELDKVLVVVAYLSGVPAALAKHLILEDIETMDQLAKASRKFANAERDSLGQAPQGKTTVGATFSSKKNGKKWANKKAGKSGDSAKENKEGKGQEKAKDSSTPASKAKSDTAGGGKEKDYLCRACRAKERPPDSCDHCRFCLLSGHVVLACPKLKEEEE